MVSTSQPRWGAWVPLWTLWAFAFFAMFGSFLSSLLRSWRSDPEFSYGILIPVIVAYLVWNRRSRFQEEKFAGHPAGLAVALIGCALHILGSFSGTLLWSGIALMVTMMGTVLYLWGLRCLRIVALPITLLVVMVPAPSYAVGEISWNLQAVASTLSSSVLRSLGVPVYHDGNLLNLPNYVLEVKQACSGSRSIFALLALALILGLSVERNWWARVLLVAAAPVLAVSANIVRIVGTGLIAFRWGSLAANESLHTTWGILVFVIAVAGLLAFQRFLQWTSNEYA